MTAITEEVVPPETNSDAAAAVAQSVHGCPADATLSGSASTGLPGDTEGDGPAEIAKLFVKVVKGSPTAEEVAALVAVLSAMAASGGADRGSNLPPESWGAPTAMHRANIPFSPSSFLNGSAVRR
ncbi:acyl-CoA carboxylase subunit epsilon [Rhodococcus marinonascens]|uniref:acyl-CoA carboxylase subunit epsilon n=1 Tax=Rhodococcus marinonascens TaxID=38311 RepID=UPI000933952C|nr:acyl-CoA carboxylase epsilon subunit [Rhodococcus marinonascens]